MNVKKFLVAAIFTALISFNTCFATEILATTTPDSNAWFTAVARDEGYYFFVVFNGQTEQGAIINYDRKLYNFYLGDSPVIFTMAVSDSPRDVDAGLGEWEDELHLLPVYALFKYANGNVMLESYLSSGVGLHPSHYQGRIQSPYHLKLAEVFLTRMPELHQAVENAGVKLP